MQTNIKQWWLQVDDEKINAEAAMRILADAKQMYLGSLESSSS